MTEYEKARDMRRKLEKIETDFLLKGDLAAALAVCAVSSKDDATLARVFDILNQGVPR